MNTKEQAVHINCTEDKATFDNIALEIIGLGGKPKSVHTMK